MPLERDAVRLRDIGVVELHDEAVIRFGSVEPNLVTRAALASADLYGPVLAALGLPPQAVLAVSCFAVTAGWTPSQLAAGTRYANYHAIAASKVRDLGFWLWPTDTFVHGVPDPRNAVHFDIVVARGLTREDLALRTGQPAERRLRRRFLPTFTQLLGELDGPHLLHRR